VNEIGVIKEGFAPYSPPYPEGKKRKQNAVSCLLRLAPASKFPEGKDEAGLELKEGSSPG
jgi:hypothetical protein